MNRGSNTTEYWNSKILREYGNQPHDFDQLEDPRNRLSYHKVAADILKKNKSSFKKKSLLEIGCATGFFTAFLKEKVLQDWDIEGWDFSEVGIIYAKKQCKKVDYKVRDILVDSIISNYGCICMFETIEHLEEGENYRVLSELIKHSEYVLISTVDTNDDCMGEHISHYKFDTFEQKDFDVRWKSKLSPIQMPDGIYHYFIVLLRGNL